MSAKVLPKERAEVKVHFEVGGPVSLAENLLNRQQSVLRRGSVVRAACLQGYQEVIRDNLV